MKSKENSSTNGVPDYDQALSAYQLAFRAELRQIVEGVSLGPNMRFLDVPCGNGYYAALFAERLGPTGKLDCVDLCADYLAKTRRKLRGALCSWEVQRADAYSLPFPDATFDVVWCAQSLISLDDPIGALQEMARVMQRGGLLVILENDIFHHILLPWPVDLEVPVERAIQNASRKQLGSSSKLAPVRRVSQMLEMIGLRSYTRTTYAADRQSPWSASLQRFLKFHVRDLQQLIDGQTTDSTRIALRRFTSGRGRESLFGSGIKDLTCLNVLYQAMK